MGKNIYYHYTSVETLFNILNNIENGYIKLRASYFMNMNDPNDCVYFINILAQLLADDEKEIKHIRKTIKQGINKAGVPYFISLSYAKDNLPMWKMYADNGHGVTIGFDKKMICQSVEHFRNSGNLHKDCFCRKYDCKYWGQEDIKNEVVDEYKLNKNNIIDKLKDTCEISYFIKDPSYSYEKESRVVFLRTDSIYDYPLYIDFQIPIDAIYSIEAGPCCNEDLVKAIVPDNLKDKVKKSKIPYRDAVVKTKPGPYNPEMSK